MGASCLSQIAKSPFPAIIIIITYYCIYILDFFTPGTVCSKVERIVGQGLNSYLMKWRSSSNSIAVRSEMQTGISSMLPSVTQLMPSMLLLLIIIESITGLMEIVKTTY